MQQTSAKEAALNIFAILGFIALLIAGLWACIQLLQLILGLALNTSVSTTAQKAISPLPSLSRSRIVMQIPTSSVTSGKPFAIGWTGANITADGTVSFSYACRSGLFFKVQAGKGTEYAIPCNAPFAISKDASALSLIAVVSTNNTIDVPVTLTYTSGTSTTKDTATVQVHGYAPIAFAPENAPEKTTPPTPVQPVAPATPAAPKPTPVPAPLPKTESTPKTEHVAPKQTTPAPAPIIVEKPVQKSNPKGFVDLEARITAVGKPGPRNTTSPRTSLLAKDTASVTFVITNNGTKAATDWAYSLVLPTDPAYTYTSPAQPTLYAGSEATITLSFDNLALGTRSLLLTADPARTTKDTARANNHASATINVR